MGKKYFLKPREEVDSSLIKIDKDANSKEIKEIFKKKDKADRLSEMQVLGYVKKCFYPLIEDIYTNRGNEYFDNLFKNIAFAKYFPDMILNNMKNKSVSKAINNIIDTCAGYYDKRENQDSVEFSEKRRYINRRYRYLLENLCWEKLMSFEKILVDDDIRFELVSKSYNIRNSVNIFAELYKIFEGKTSRVWNVMSLIMEASDAEIIGEILATRKRLPDELSEEIYKRFTKLDYIELREALTYYAKREKVTIARSDNDIEKIKTQLVLFLENNTTNNRELKSLMKDIIKTDITLIESFDYILKNEHLFKGERLYPFSAIVNKNKIEREFK